MLKIIYTLLDYSHEIGPATDWFNHRCFAPLIKMFFRKYTNRETEQLFAQASDSGSRPGEKWPNLGLMGVKVEMQYRLL